jgi:hypothetical protein
MRIGFLLNHRIDQAWHAAPVAFECSRLYTGAEVGIICANRHLAETVERIAASFPEHRCQLRLARLPTLTRLLDPLARTWFSLEKLSVLRHNCALFRTLDAVVAPDLTSLKLKDIPGLGRLKMVLTRHGAGDRAKGFDRRIGQFDFVLVPGAKVERRLQAAQLVKPEHYRIIGYPKFDAIARQPDPLPLFNNSRPVVLYNPHFDPRLSSWPKLGLEILDYFAHSDRYNLIFAPHLKLFGQARRFGARLPPRYRHCDNIHVDTGSPASADMTYTLLADLYLGDVSSQVYEFLWRPRPCIFLNAHAVDWRNDPDYAHWHLGPVLTQARDLSDALHEAWRTHSAYLPRQRAALADTFDLTQTGSASRAARAIGEFLKIPADSTHNP